MLLIQARDCVTRCSFECNVAVFFLPNHYLTASLSIYKTLHYKMQSLSPQTITETLSYYDQLIRQALEDGNVVELLTQHDETLVSHGTEHDSNSDRHKQLENKNCK